jgi:hypothetical protein
LRQGPEQASAQIMQYDQTKWNGTGSCCPPRCLPTILFWAPARKLCTGSFVVSHIVVRIVSRVTSRVVSRFLSCGVPRVVSRVASRVASRVVSRMASCLASRVAFKIHSIGGATHVPDFVRATVASRYTADFPHQKLP